jgi:hypothetical protein
MGHIYAQDAGGNAEYNAFLLSAQHRFSNHYTLLGNYTWSHCIDESDFGGTFNGTYYQNPTNRNADRGNCGFDIRQIFNLSFVATTPRFAGLWTNRLLGNWQLAPIVTARTGQTLSLFTGSDNSLTGIELDRPNKVPGVDLYVKNMHTLQWLNPTAFVPNPTGTFGNLGMNSLKGPSFFEVDTALSRYFNIPRHESQRVEVGFEAFTLSMTLHSANS